MKKQFKIWLIISISIFSLSNVYAQLGIQAGYAYSPSTGNLELGNFNEYSGQFKLSGFQGGITYQFFIKGNLGMETALLYSDFAGRNTKQDATAFGITGDLRVTSTYQYLDLPIRVSYYLPVTNDFKLFVFAGPNLTYALAGKSESIITGIGSGTTVNRKMPEYENVYSKFEDDLSRFDLKLGFGAGLQQKKFKVKIGYDFGILNAYTGEIKKNSSNNNFSSRRGQLSISVAYLLW